MIKSRVRSLGWFAVLAATLIVVTSIPTVSSAQIAIRKARTAVSVGTDDLEKELQHAIKSILVKHRKELDELRSRSESRIAELEAQTARLSAQVDEMRQALATRGTGAGVSSDAGHGAAIRPASAAADRPFLGVALGPPADGQLSKLGVERGVQVLRVVPETPAAHVGLKAEDVITRLVGKAVDFETFSQAIASSKAGDRVAIEYSRLVDGQPVRFEARVKLGRRGDFVAAEGAAPPSIRVAPPEPPVVEKPVEHRAPVKLGARVRQEEENNLVIIEVTPGSNAAEAGLRAGDKLVAIGDTKLATIDTVKEALGALRSGDTQTITYSREGTTSHARLKWGAGHSKPSLMGSRTDEAAPKAKKKKGFLGVSVDPSDGKLTIDEVVDGSSAAQMGIEVGDLILSVNGKEYADIEELHRLFASLWAGDSLTILVKRGEKNLTLKGVLGERKDGEPSAAAPDPQSKPYVGIEVRERGTELEVAEVFGGSAAERAGMKVGDLLVSIDGRSLQRLEDIRDALDARFPGDVIDAVVIREGARVGVSLTLGAH